jgi:hypothetical protein
LFFQERAEGRKKRQRKIGSGLEQHAARGSLFIIEDIIALVSHETIFSPTILSYTFVGSDPMAILSMVKPYSNLENGIF